jgi:energy-converting hydrogenase Eha subunit A
MQGFGLTICATTIALALFYLVNHLIQTPIQAPGITTIVLLVLGLGGIQLFSLSFVGDYVEVGD